jgi:hypothetical protein
MVFWPFNKDPSDLSILDVSMDEKGKVIGKGYRWEKTLASKGPKETSTK